MSRHLSFTLLALCAAAHAADPALERAARALGVERIDSLEYEASGTYYQFTQAPAPDLPWPPFRVEDYVATLDYARAAIHAKYHREQVQEPGRARPPAEATMDQFAVDSHRKVAEAYDKGIYKDEVIPLEVETPVFD